MCIVRRLLAFLVITWLSIRAVGRCFDKIRGGPAVWHAMPCIAIGLGYIGRLMMEAPLGPGSDQKFRMLVGTRLTRLKQLNMQTAGMDGGRPRLPVAGGGVVLVALQEVLFAQHKVKLDSYYN